MKKAVIALTLVIFMFLFTGCFDSKEQKKLNAEYVSTAMTNAINYIEEKYDFTPEILDAVQERAYGVFGSEPLTTVYVRMTHNGRNFGVYIDGSCENTDGSDNYQQPELEAYFTNLIMQKLPQPATLALSSGSVNTPYDSIEDECINMHSAYFDGTNISELLLEGGCSVVAEYVSTDISALSEADFPDELLRSKKSNIHLVSFRSSDYLGRYSREMLPFYADSTTVIDESGTSRKTYLLGKDGDISYYIDGESCDSVTVTEVKPDDGSSWNDDSFRVETASKAYTFQSTQDCTVDFFFPQSAIAPITGKDTFQACGICRKSGGERTFESFYIHDFSDDYEVGQIQVNAGEEVDIVFLHKTKKT